MSEGELRLYKDLVNAERVSHIDFKLIAKKLFDELQQKENIIKEVREYINNHLYMESTGGIQHPTFDGKMNRDTNGFEILEILDKEVN